MWRILAAAVFATQTFPFTHASDLESRAIIKLPSNRIPHDIETPNVRPNPIRGGGAIDDNPPLRIGDGQGSAYKPPVPLLRSADDVGPNALQEGKADKTMHLCRTNKEDCQELIETAADLILELFGQLGGGEETMTTTTTSASSQETPRVGIGRPNVKENKGSLRNVPIPNLNMSTWMSGSDYRSVYTKDEFSLLRFDPLCFFASQERIYRALSEVFLENSAPKSDKEKRDCRFAGDECDTSKSTEKKASDLYLSYLPDQISQVYLSTPSQVTVEGTSTTKCPSFTVDTATIEAFETEYAVFGWREGEDPKEKESQETGMTAPTGPAGSAGEIKSGVTGVSGGTMVMGLTGVALLFMLF